MLHLRLQGLSYAAIAQAAGVSRQRVQQLLSPSKGVRDYIIAQCQGKCLDCGIPSVQGGHIHHNNAVPTLAEDYNDITNLVLLCPSCHRKRHKQPKAQPDKPIKDVIEPSTQEVLDSIDMTESLDCTQCQHQWYPRSPQPPQMCPRCKSRNWNREK